MLTLRCAFKQIDKVWLIDTFFNHFALRPNLVLKSQLLEQLIEIFISMELNLRLFERDLQLLWIDLFWLWSLRLVWGFRADLTFLHFSSLWKLLQAFVAVLWFQLTLELRWSVIPKRARAEFKLAYFVADRTIRLRACMTKLLSARCRRTIVSTLRSKISITIFTWAAEIFNSIQSHGIETFSPLAFQDI